MGRILGLVRSFLCLHPSCFIPLPCFPLLVHHHPWYHNHHSVLSIDSTALDNLFELLSMAEIS